MIRLFLLGKDIRNSRSPELYKDFFRERGVDGNYNLMDIDNELVGDFVAGVKRQGINGFNVTAPYKEDIIKYLDEVSDEGLYLNSINTVVNRNGKLFGYNTDLYGARESLKYFLEDGNVLVLGRGATARTIVYALKQLRFETDVYIRGGELKGKVFDDIKPIYDLNGVKYTNVINATSAGFNNDEAIISEPLEAQLTAYDVIYTPWETGFLKAMKKRGLKTKNGFELLTAQARESFRYFIGDI